MRRTRWLVFMLILGVVGGWIWSASAAPIRAQADVPPKGEILFVSKVEGKNEVFLVNTDGTGLKQLTNTPGKTGASYAPIWSPDGTKFYYTVRPDPTSSGETSEIWVFDFRTQKRTRLLSYPLGEEFILNQYQFGGWTANSRQIVYGVTRLIKEKAHLEFFIIDADSSNRRALNPDGVPNLSNVLPIKDGFLLIDIEGNATITDAALKNPQPIGTPQAYSFVAVISPDRQWIALANKAKVDVIDLATGKFASFSVFYSGTSIWYMGWSPDNKRFWVQTDRQYDANGSVIEGSLTKVVDVDRMLKNDPSPSSIRDYIFQENRLFPIVTWSPNGEWLLDDQDGILNFRRADGTGEAIPFSPVEDKAYQPAWRPVQK
ncbi:MAG TPA: hypothetical protein PLD47_02705 [Aggregatilineales bacterium]|nr:hypothetical protein [Aggregatilineales bacterium]